MLHNQSILHSSPRKDLTFCPYTLQGTQSYPLHKAPNTSALERALGATNKNDSIHEILPFTELFWSKRFKDDVVASSAVKLTEKEQQQENQQNVVMKKKTYKDRHFQFS